MPLYPAEGETLQENLSLAVQLQRALFAAGIRVVLPQIGFCLAVQQPEPKEWNFGQAVAIDVLHRCDGLILAGRRLSTAMETEREVAAMGSLKVMDVVSLCDAAVVEAVNVTECLSELEENTTEVLA
jgi:hypothetical protein